MKNLFPFALYTAVVKALLPIQQTTAGYRTGYALTALIERTDGRIWLTETGDVARETLAHLVALRASLGTTPNRTIPEMLSGYQDKRAAMYATVAAVFSDDEAAAMDAIDQTQDAPEFAKDWAQFFKQESRNEARETWPEVRAYINAL